MSGNCENCCENVNETIRKRKLFFCGLIWALILTAFAIRVIKYYSSSPAGQLSSNGTWDYLIFAQSWPISFCKTISAKKNNPTEVCSIPRKNAIWTIHGLWPNKNYNSPQYCVLMPLNATELEPILDQLEAYWSSTKKNTTKMSFWDYEWRKHGTCALQTEKLNTQLKYFNQTLELYKQYNVTKALDDCGIHPNDSKVLKHAELADCFQKTFKIDPILDCRKVNGKQVLNEVRFCLDKELNVKSCKIFGVNVKLCKGDITYPANVIPQL